MDTLTIPNPLKRQFLPEKFVLTNWDNLQPYYKNLLDRTTNSPQELEEWLLDRSELNAIVSEDLRWRIIRLTCDTLDKKVEEAYNYSVQEIQPKLSAIENKLNQKLIDSPYCSILEAKYPIHFRSIRNRIKLFCKENIDVFTDIQIKAKEYGSVMSKMEVEIDGQQMTIQQAMAQLSNTDRTVREKVYRAVSDRRMQDGQQLEDLFDELIAMRHQVALNAGFENYRDYKFKALGRFDYEPEDCHEFHDAIAAEIVPLIEKFNQIRKNQLGVEQLRPWDLSVNPSGLSALKPSENLEELIKKSITCLERTNPYFGECLAIMNKMNRLDLESRKGKRPGGYNMSLPETIVPFVFMNAANSIRDMRTLMHESGHAVHSFLVKDLTLTSSKRTTSEVAELAAMSMELLSMAQWDTFFEDAEELRRAKMWQIENALTVLPWVATIDKFQHWIYTNPKHNQEERKAAWMSIRNEFSSKVVEWDGLEAYHETLWHRQLHLFEIPFYYVEYGMAQLGAIAVWKRYTENPSLAIEDYISALKLGYTKTIKEIYATAGIEFNFSKDYIHDLAKFMKAELNKLM